MRWYHELGCTVCQTVCQTHEQTSNWIQRIKSIVTKRNVQYLTPYVSRDYYVVEIERMYVQVGVVGIVVVCKYSITVVKFQQHTSNAQLPRYAIKDKCEHFCSEKYLIEQMYIRTIRTQITVLKCRRRKELVQ